MLQVGDFVSVSIFNKEAELGVLVILGYEVNIKKKTCREKKSKCGE